MHPPPVPYATNPPPLLERVRRAARARGDSQPTADNLVTWVRAFILFHPKRHPGQMGLPEVTHFLEHVVQTRPDPLPALAQAREALTLRYGGVLGRDLGELPHPRPPRVLDQLRLVLRVRHNARRTDPRGVTFMPFTHFLSENAYKCPSVRMYKVLSAMTGVAPTRSPSPGFRATTSGLAAPAFKTVTTPSREVK